MNYFIVHLLIAGMTDFRALKEDTFHIYVTG